MAYARTRVSHRNGETPGLANENAQTFHAGTSFGDFTQHALVHPDFAVRGSASSFALVFAIVVSLLVESAGQGSNLPCPKAPGLRPGAPPLEHPTVVQICS